MSVWDWLSKKMDEDMPRDSFAEQLEKRKQKAEEEHRQRERQVASRITELKQAFEASGRKYNSAEPCEVETLLTLTEKKIIQQCRRPKCHGCKLGWICPKFWAE